MLIEFKRTGSGTPPADLGEKIGNVALKPLRLICGKKVQINKNSTLLEGNTTSTSKRIGIAILSVLAFPIVVTITLIGVSATLLSKSYSEAKKLPPSERDQNPEQLSEKIPYFAFGSNMSRKRIERRLGCVDVVGKAALENHELLFNKHSSSDNSGKANVRAKEGSVVEGGVFLLTNEQLEKLDVDEGCGSTPPHYIRKKISVTLCETGEPLMAEIYIAIHPSRLRDNLKPAKDYLGHILTGAKEFKLSAAAVARINSFGMTIFLYGIH